MKNIANKKITILGSGLSGIGAAKLANYLGANVLLSDRKSKLSYKLDKNIQLELGGHTEKCYNCDLLIISPGINPNCDFIEPIKEKQIPIISEIEFASLFNKGKIIAITGSNGKSTTVKIVQKILKNKFSNTLMGGNIGISFSENVLNEIKNKLTDVIHLLELSSFQLELISQFKPDISCFLNLSPDHLDRHLNIDNYFKAKNNIIKNYSNDDVFLFNEDDAFLNKKYQDCNYLKFSIKNKKNRIFVKDNFIISDQHEGDIINYNNIKLKGKHNLENLLAAITITKLMSLSNSQIRRALKDFHPLNHRLEYISNKNDILFINDSKATNIESTIAAIKSSSKKTILILGGYSKGKIDYKSYLKNHLKNIKHIICYGEEGKCIYDVVSKLTNCTYIKIFDKAILHAIKIAEKNNRVLLSPACSSFDQFKSFQERGNKFKEIIKHYYI